jgi:hypothetical protein
MQKPKQEVGMERWSNPVDAERIHSKLFNLGLSMNVLAPVVLIIVGAVLRAKGVSMGGQKNLQIFFWALLFVALSEIPAIYIVRKTLLSGRRLSEKGRVPSTPEQILMQWGVITFSLALAPSIYGLIYHLLGGSLERFVLFAAITLFCFLVFKPKEEQISSFIRDRSSSEGSTPGV